MIRQLRRTYVAVVRWTDELLWGGHKWVCRFEALCVCTRWTDEREWSRCLGSMEPGLLSRSPSNFGWPEPKHFKWWSRSLKFGFRFHSPSLLSKRVVQIMRRSSVFNRLNRLEPELINLGRSSAGWMPARIGRLSAGLGRRHPVTIRKASLMVGSMRRVWALRHQTGAQYSVVEWTRDRVGFRNVVAPEQTSHLKSATRDVKFLRSRPLIGDIEHENLKHGDVSDNFVMTFIPLMSSLNPMSWRSVLCNKSLYVSWVKFCSSVVGLNVSNFTLGY